MLVILSGSETVHKKFFARRVISHLNAFKIENYVVDYSKHPFEVYDQTGKLVYRPEHDDVEGCIDLLCGHEAQPTIVYEAVRRYEDIFNDQIRDNHFNNIFLDIIYDYGIVPEPSETVVPGAVTYLNPHKYSDIINSYKNRQYDTFVITGSFSKSFIDRIRGDLGKENVIAYNIIRHPSVTYALHEKTAEYYAAKAPMNPVTDDKKVRRAVFNCANLMRYDDVITVRFEDILASGSFVVNGVDIGVPPGYDNYNGWITQWEKDNVVPLHTVSPERVAEFNEYCSNFDFADLESDECDKANIVQVINDQFGSTYTREEIDQIIPTNLFTALGYTPLTYEQIVNGSNS